MQLTRDDIQDLLEALDAWESSKTKDNLMGTMLGAMLSRSKSEADEFIKGQQEQWEKDKEQERSLKERVILLKAKLIQIRDTMDVEAFTGEIDA